MATSDESVMAWRAFDLFTQAERRRALEHFAQLKYPSIDDRWFEAVYRVIHESDERGGRAVGIR